MNCISYVGMYAEVESDGEEMSSARSVVCDDSNS